MENKKIIERILTSNQIKINNDDLIELIEKYKKEHYGKEPVWGVEVLEGGKAKGKKSTLEVDGENQEENEEDTCYVVGKVKIIGEKEEGTDTENSIVQRVIENTEAEEAKQEEQKDEKNKKAKRLIIIPLFAIALGALTLGLNTCNATTQDYFQPTPIEEQADPGIEDNDDDIISTSTDEEIEDGNENENENENENTEEQAVTEQVTFYDIDNLGEILKAMVAEFGQEGLTANGLSGEGTFHGEFYDSDEQAKYEKTAVEVYNSFSEIKSNIDETKESLTELTAKQEEAESSEASSEEKEEIKENINEELGNLEEYYEQMKQLYADNQEFLADLAEKFEIATTAFKDALSEEEIGISNDRVEKANENEELLDYNMENVEALKDGVENGTKIIDSVTQNPDGSFTVVYYEIKVIEKSNEATISESEVEAVAEETTTQGLISGKEGLKTLEQTIDEAVAGRENESERGE